jgi:hypothetical protein
MMVLCWWWRRTRFATVARARYSKKIWT